MTFKRRNTLNQLFPTTPRDPLRPQQSTVDKSQRGTQSDGQLPATLACTQSSRVAGRRRSRHAWFRHAPPVNAAPASGQFRHTDVRIVHAHDHHTCLPGGERAVRGRRGGVGRVEGRGGEGGRVLSAHLSACRGCRPCRAAAAAARGRPVQAGRAGRRREVPRARPGDGRSSEGQVMHTGVNHCYVMTQALATGQQQPANQQNVVRYINHRLSAQCDEWRPPVLPVRLDHDQP